MRIGRDGHAILDFCRFDEEPRQRLLLFGGEQSRGKGGWRQKGIREDRDAEDAAHDGDPSACFLEGQYGRRKSHLTIIA